MLVADIHGSVHILDKEFEPTTSWVAHVGGRVTHMAEKQDILVTLGVRALPVICLSVMNLSTGRRHSETAFNEDMAPRKDGQERVPHSPSFGEATAKQPSSSRNYRYLSPFRITDLANR